MKNSGLSVFYNGKQWREEKTYAFVIMSMVATILFTIGCLFGLAVIIGALSKVFYMMFKFGWGFWF